MDRPFRECGKGAAEGHVPKSNAVGRVPPTCLEPATPVSRTSAALDDEDRTVLERDGWTCALCGQAIEPARSWPDPLSGSVDRSRAAPVDEAQPAGARAAHLVCSQLADGLRNDTRAASAGTPGGPAA